MSADDNDHDDPEDTGDVRERIEQEADRAVEQFDEGIVDLLAWALDTETRARIYVHLRQHPESTSEEIAEGTGLYPSTVREALAALTEEEVVTRQKRESDGAGNNPYEYSAIPPSDLVNTIVGDIQSELNTVFNLDDHIGGETTLEPDDEPVTISVEDANDGTDDADASEDTGDDGDESEGENDDTDV
ncbi:winged helix-turn-helix domain-containing protein [Haloarcula sebkhae]|uniref:Helix-turn-helix domain-containing protein n=2 Tax=Haloarcula sebkhae TaxID=932660 RepID=A0ACC6VRA0_9EURY|nr:winged helix-turn-helix domain-containing protein [Haloarcula sebkhae]GGK65630.1 transcriptional regulator [Haloarcula sebkhae]